MSCYHHPMILRDGLHFYFDAANPRSYGGSGTVMTDISQTGRHGNMVDVSVVNDEMIFNGTTSSVRLPTSDIPLRTIVAIIRVSSIGIAQTIISPQTAGSDNRLQVGTTGQIQLLTAQSSDTFNSSLFSNFVVVPNEPCMVTVTIGTTHKSIYINGEFDAEYTAVDHIFSDWKLLVDIGKRGNIESIFFNGGMKLVMGYDRILSTEEIRYLYNAHRGRLA